MARVLVGLIVGLLLVFPGVELLRFLTAELFGVYDDMTLTEAFLAMVIVLQAILIARGAKEGSPAVTAGRQVIIEPRRQTTRSAPRSRPNPRPAPRRRTSPEEPKPPARRSATRTTSRTRTEAPRPKDTGKRRRPKRERL